MKKMLAVFLALILTFTFVTPTYATGAIGDEEATTEHPETTEYPDNPSRPPDLVCNAAIVMDAGTGQILYEKNAYDKKYPASITKILTILVALEHGVNFDETISMSENAIWGIERDSTNIGLDVGEKVTVRDIMYATLVKSANECAYAVAELVAGNIESFADLMNKRAEELGCQSTHFVTPNGLHDDNHYTCAYDMALITRQALKNDTFREIAGTLSYTVPKTNLADVTRPLLNGNRMINPAEPYYYQYCKGGKTGYTTKANNTLVTYAQKDGLELICVILDCDGLKYSYSDTRALYNYCYNNYSYFYPLSDFSFESDKESTTDKNTILENFYFSMSHEMVDLVVDKSYSLLLNKSVDTTKIEKVINLYDTAQDNVLGEINFIYNGEQIGTTPITSTTPLLSSQMTQDEKDGPSIWNKIGKVLLYILLILLGLVLLLIFYMGIAVIIRKFRRNNRRRGYRRRRRRRKDDDYYYF